LARSAPTRRETHLSHESLPRGLTSPRRTHWRTQHPTGGRNAVDSSIWRVDARDSLTALPKIPSPASMAARSRVRGGIIWHMPTRGWPGAPSFPYVDVAERPLTVLQPRDRCTRQEKVRCSFLLSPRSWDSDRVRMSRRHCHTSAPPSVGALSASSTWEEGDGYGTPTSFRGPMFIPPT